MGAPLRSYLAGDSVPERLVNFLSAFREVKLLALAVTLTNIAGVAYGIVYYWDQLNDTAWYLLPFVPDSPTGPFLMVIVYALWWFKGKTRNRALELLAFVELVKFGIWTVLIFWIYRDAFFAPNRVQLTQTLLALHLAEALEAAVLLKGFRMPRLRWAVFIAAWLALTDFSDYALGTHPRLPSGIPMGVGPETVPSITVALTIICYLAAVVVARRGSKPPAKPGGNDDAPPPPPS